MLRLLCLVVPLLILSGCTTVQNPDGTTRRVIGFDSPEAQAKANESVKTLSTFLPWPFDAIVSSVGVLGVTLISAYAAKKKGEEQGWDQAHAESPALKPSAQPEPPAKS